MIRTYLLGFARDALWLSPVVLVMGVFFAAIPWLEPLDDWIVMLVGAAAAITVMAYAVVLSVRTERRQDEVQRAGARAAFRWGALGGGVATVLLLMLPAVQNLVVDAASVLSTGDAASVLSTGSPERQDREAVLLAAFFGFALFSLAQSVGTLIASAVWRWWISKP